MGYTVELIHSLNQRCPIHRAVLLQSPVAPNFCFRAIRKSYFFHTNRRLGTLDFTVSEHWAPFNFP